MTVDRKSVDKFENPYSTQVTASECYPAARFNTVVEDQTTQTQSFEATQLCASASVPTVKARIVNVIDGSIFELSDTRSELAIGRHPHCDIVISDVNVSARHLSIRRDDYSFCLTDNSSNGTFISGSRVNRGETRRLKPGDEISLVQNSYKPAENAKFVFMFSEASVATVAHTISSTYDLGKVLGKGNFSEVLLAICKQTGERVAVKVVDTLKTEQFSRKSKSVAIDLESESRLLASLSHRNIVRFYGCFKDPNKLYIVTELMDGGDLLNRLLDKGAFNEDTGRSLFRQICQGVQYLHDRNIVHRDIKPENILLNREGTVPKISDFGLARFSGQQNANPSNMKTYCGTPHYFAPEMFKLQRHEVQGYGPEVDCWSLGVILYVLLSARPPFSDDDLAAQVEEGSYDFDCPEFSAVSEEAKDLIKSCMSVDPEKRLKIDQILTHRWFDEQKKRKPVENGDSQRDVFSQGKRSRN